MKCEADRPGLFNHSDLVVEVDELHQLLLQDFLSAHRLRDEAVLQQVQHVWAQLKVLDQTPARGAQSAFGRFPPPKTTRLSDGAAWTDLQMKSLKPSDQSSGWWRVGGGFLSSGEMEKINGKIR